MAVPRGRRSASRQGKVRSHHARKPKNTSACPNCGTSRLPHRVCINCGQYNGRVVIAAAQAQ